MSIRKNELANLKSELEILKNRLSNSGSCGNCLGLFQNHLYGYALCDIVAGKSDNSLDFVPLEINLKLGEMLGFKPEKVIGQSLKKLFPAAKDSPFFHKVKDIVDSGMPGHFEFWSAVLSRWLEITVFSPVTGRFIATIIDITDRKQTEQNLLKTQEAFRDLVENVNDALYSVDPQGIITYVSRPIKRILGYEPEELIGISYVNLIHPDDLEQIKKEFEKVLENVLYPSEYRLLTRSGEYKWVRTSSRPILEKDKIVGIRGVLVDISEHKLTEEALRQSEERYRLLFENASEVIANISKEGKYLFLNKSAANFLCRSTADIEGKYLWEIFPIEGEKMYKQGILKVFDTGKGIITERQHTIKGELRWFRTNLQPVLDASGEICSVLIISNDIDAQKRLSLYYEARLQLLQKLRRARDIDECLKCGCEAILKAGLFSRAVLTLHNHKREITNLGQIGLDEESVNKARNAPAPSIELNRKITQDKFRIGHSYFVPVESEIFSNYIPRAIPQNGETVQRQNAWEAGDELFVPIISNDDIIEGWLSVDTPIDGSRPTASHISDLEEIVSIVAQRVHEIQSLELLIKKSEALEKSNTTLTGLMDMFDEKKAEIFNQISTQVVRKLIPALNKLVRRDGSINKTYLQVLKSGLSELINVSGTAREILKNLTPREREICDMIKAGLTNKEISDELNISEDTVKKHREKIRKKLGLTHKKTSLWNFLNNL